MFNDYAASLEARLLDRDYIPVQYNMWALPRPPILYVVTLCDAAHTNLEALAQRQNQLLPRFQLEKAAATHLLALNLVYTEGPTPAQRAFVDKQPVLTDQTVSQIWWMADGLENRLSPGKGQPEKLGDLRELCTAAFGPAPPPLERKVLSPAWYRPRDHRMTIFLIMVNAMFYLVELGAGDVTTFIRAFGNQPQAIFNGHQYFRLLTSVFFHLSPGHLACNSLALYIFGSLLEDVLSRGQFLALYLTSGVVGSLFSALFTRGLSAGASGAIFGVMGGLLAFTLVSKKKLSGFDSLTFLVFALGFFLSGAIIGGVDQFAHLGGFLTGFLIMLVQARQGFLRHSGPPKKPGE